MPPPPGPPQTPPEEGFSFPLSVSVSVSLPLPLPLSPHPPDVNLADRVFGENTDSVFLRTRPPAIWILHRGGVKPYLNNPQIREFWFVHSYKQRMFWDAMLELNQGILECLQMFGMDTTEFEKKMLVSEPVVCYLTIDWIIGWHRGWIRMEDNAAGEEYMRKSLANFLAKAIKDYLTCLGMEEDDSTFKILTDKSLRLEDNLLADLPLTHIYACSVQRGQYAIESQFGF